MGGWVCVWGGRGANPAPQNKKTKQKTTTSPGSGCSCVLRTLVWLNALFACVVYGSGKIYTGLLLFAVSVCACGVCVCVCGHVVWCVSVCCVLCYSSMFQIGELGNLSIHLALRDLRPPGEQHVRSGVQQVSHQLALSAAMCDPYCVPSLGLPPCRYQRAKHSHPHWKPSHCSLQLC